ncbi:MAG: hypothetical protein ACPGQL_04425 [Thermoplasmatota archaeon]
MMDELLEEFPRAGCHMDDVDEKIQAFEAKYCTPLNDEDMRGVFAEVHSDHEDCPCDCCAAA